MVRQPAEDLQSTLRRERRAHEAGPVQRPQAAYLLRLQGTAGNQAVSRLIQRSRLLARMLVLDVGTEQPQDLAALPNGAIWWECVKAPDGVVWVHTDLLGDLDTLLPGYELTGTHEDLEQPANVDTANSLFATEESPASFAGSSALDIGLGDSHAGSQTLTFGTAKEIGKGFAEKTVVDPHETAEIDAKAIVGGLAKSYPGVLTKLFYRAPSATRTHFEIMSEAVIEREKQDDSPPFFIKFDFTSAGYRMIYRADEDAGGLQTLAEKALGERVPVATAMETFRAIATSGGEYDEGSNECGTFARNFFMALTGEDPDTIDAGKTPAEKTDDEYALSS